MENKSKKAKLPLDNASKRYTITLVSVMIKIQHKGKTILCDTAEEAAELLKRLEAVEQERIVRQIPGAFDLNPLGNIFGGGREVSVWTRKSFGEFIENLGSPQRKVMAILTKRVSRVSDEELRKAMNVGSNQHLAGILSGISKQAGAMNIPARAVYVIENEFSGGVSSKYYAVARDFLLTAHEMNWPDE